MPLPTPHPVTPDDPPAPEANASDVTVGRAPGSPPRAPGARTGDGGAGLPVVVLALGALIGVALRLLVLRTDLGRPDADEVLSALMARHIGTDGYPLFVWGQHYGGTLQLAPVALSLRLLGWSTIGLRAPNLVLGAVNALLLWRVGTHVVSRRQAQVAGLLVWIGPAQAVWFGVREQLFYPPTVTLGLLLALLAVRLRTRDRLGDYAWVGLVVGLAVWTSANLAYFLLPAAAVALVRTGRPWSERRAALVRGVPVAVATALVGMAPWLLDNLRTGGAALRAGGSFPVIGTYPGRFAYFFTDGLPGVLGFREVFTYRWVGGPVGVVGYLAVLGLIGLALVRALPRIRWDAVGFAVFPFVFAALPMVMDDPNMRYLFFVVPFVALLLAGLVRSDRVAVVSLVVALALTGVGLHRIHTVSEVEASGFRVGNVGDLGPAIAALDRAGVTEVHADYWVAYRLAFETEERIVASPSWGIDRYPPYTARVEAAARPAWVVTVGPQLDALVAALDRLGVPADVVAAGEMAVVLPARPVAPGELPEAARRAPS